jgi:putative restriction endonuclease
MIKDLTYYCSCFEKLRRDQKNGGAPHKPVLLISLIEAFQKRIYNSRKISIVPEIVGLFKSNWETLVETNHQCLFTLPFYHMSTEPFWQLVPNPGCELWVKSKSSMRSFSNLNTAIKYAQIDDELVQIFLDENDSEILLHFLLDKYFPSTKINFRSGNNDYINDIKFQITKESKANYKKRLILIKKQLDDLAFQEEVFVRSNVFKKEVPKLYNYTCCITGLRIDAIESISMVDACHIVPFSESYDDTITNGIALCPNFHRAFDRGLVSIDKNFRVLVSKNFIETIETNYSIKQFEGKEILLPKNKNYFPSSESLNHHRERFGF